MAEVVCKSNVFSLCNGTNITKYHLHKRYRPTNLSFRSISCFHGRRVLVAPSNPAFVGGTSRKASNIQMSIGIAKAQRWWEKGTKANMRQVVGAQDLVDSLHNAGDKLVVVDFYSPGCGGCKALHPKLCQLAEMNPDVQFLQVNYEEHKSMCYSLNVHVLPFFRFYRGAHGRLCSFSCTNATIKKFKDALAKHSPERCSLGEPKGLEEKELAALSSNKDLSFTYTPKPEQPALPKEEGILTGQAVVSDTIQHPPLPLPRPLEMNLKNTKNKTLVSS
ncbi:thioredoxin-like 1-1, chloroplastic [Apium graveolens]|uniref:thioredoxin-like 1-1, chloroplastic n=1 Tax=Apium graveolens TaxID=4045 RepID=UPI003D7A978E